LYLPFTITFVTEIVPALLRGGARAGGPAAPATGGPFATLMRVPIFYGWVYPLLTVAGLFVLRRRGRPEAFPALLAYALAVATLLALKAFGGGMFRDLKEETFAAPLVAVATGAFLETLEGLVPRGRLVAALVALGLLIFGLARFAELVAAYASLAGTA
jgi:hypothetical protein